MKRSRSDNWTTGITCTFGDSDHRFFFFEIDELDHEKARLVDSIFDYYQLDYLRHRTKQGWHWLSPTMIPKSIWKEAMTFLSDINRECPMITMRWLPNKYPNEDQIWYLSKSINQPMRNFPNSIEFCNLLNHTFASNFRGEEHQEPQFVRYPLPYVCV